jgi:hypothetical protein
MPNDTVTLLIRLPYRLCKPFNRVTTTYRIDRVKLSTVLHIVKLCNSKIYEVHVKIKIDCLNTILY